MNAAIVVLLGAAAALMVISSAGGGAASDEPDRTWWDRSVVDDVGSFRIRSDLTTSEVRSHGRGLSRTLGAIDASLGPLRSRTPARLDVLLFRDHETMSRTMLQRYGADVTNRAALFHQAPSGPVLAVNLGTEPTRRLNRLTQYELMRYYAADRFGGDLPPWIEFGLAELFSDAVLDESRSYVGAVSQRRLERLREDLEQHGSAIYSEMARMDGRQWADRATPAMHDRAWAAAHWLMSDQRREQFRQLLGHINDGRTAESAMQRVFDGFSGEALARRCRVHIEAMRPDPFQTAMERLEVLADGMLMVHRQGIVVTSLDELRENLDELEHAARFARPAGWFDAIAIDDALFALPPRAKGEDDEQPALVMEPPGRRPASMQELELEKENPRPHTLRTRHVRPRNIRVEWIRVIEGNTFRYELTIEQR